MRAIDNKRMERRNNATSSDPLINNNNNGQQPPPSSSLSSDKAFSKRRWISALGFLAIILGFMFAATQKGSPTGVRDADVKIICPPTPAWMHAQCSMTFEVRDFMCRDVKEEVERRLLGKDDWIDPKSHPGKYLLLESKSSSTLGQRTTGDGTNYTDKFTLTYTDVQGKGCIVAGCSIAQATSYYDYSTNYCNMHNLMCGKIENCKVSRHDMRPPVESYEKCLFHDVTQCFR